VSSTGTTVADRVPAPLLVLVSVASVQTGSAVARTLFDVTGPAGVTLLRLAFAAVLLMAVTRPAVRLWTRAQWTAAVALGLSMGAMNLVFYAAIREVPLGVAVTVEFMGPLLVALAQTRRVLDLLWVVLAGSGVVLLGLRDTGATPLAGLGLALLAGLFWGGYILASARVGQLLPGVQGLAVALCVSTLLAVPFGLSGAARGVADGWALLVGALVALLSSVVPYALELTALRRLPTRVFGVLMSLEPGAAAIAGLLVLDQRLGHRELVALLLVSLASVGVTLGRRADAPPSPVD
jgi:inner membrane transporter RhtA